jgi:hypothetical protein
MDRAKIEEMRKIVSDECNRVARLLMTDTPPGGETIHRELEKAEHVIGNRVAAIMRED